MSHKILNMLSVLTDLGSSCANSSSSSSVWLLVSEITIAGVVALGVEEDSPGLELFILDWSTVHWASFGTVLELSPWIGKGVPEAIASCLASKLWILSFNSKPFPRSSSSLRENQDDNKRLFHIYVDRLHKVTNKYKRVCARWKNRVELTQLLLASASTFSDLCDSDQQDQQLLRLLQPYRA